MKSVTEFPEKPSDDVWNRKPSLGGLLYKCMCLFSPCITHGNIILELPREGEGGRGEVA